MRTRQLGDLQVGAIGLGGMPLSVEGAPDHDDAVRVVHAALDAGVTLVDTADAYTPDGRMGHNEELIADALRSWGGDASEVLVATKGGHTRDGHDWGLDGSPAYLRRACEASIRRLGVEAIGLWQHHRPDPDVPYEDTLGAVRELVDAGLVVRAGLSNADPAQIHQAHEIVGDALVSVQNQLSPTFTSSLPEVETCQELGLAFLPWSPLGGIGRTDDATRPFSEVADRVGASPQQVCLAWLLALSPSIVPIPGASKVRSVESSVAAAELELAPEDVEMLSRSVA